MILYVMILCDTLCIMSIYHISISLYTYTYTYIHLYLHLHHIYIYGIWTYDINAALMTYASLK